MRVTIADVAREAGISVSTVSRAFTAPELLRDETRAHVITVAERMGYRPNRAARGLVTGKTGNIGVVVPDLGNPFFPAILKGAQARARESDYAVFLADCDEDPGAEMTLVQAMAKQVDGVVLCASRMSAAQLERVAGDTPFVLVNRRFRGHPAVTMNVAGAMRQAIDHLAALGHRRIAYLGGPRASWANRERRRGLRHAARYGLEIVQLGPFAPHYASGAHAADLAIAAEVTAVIAYNDLIALGVMARLANRGLTVPGDMSVAGFDDIPMAAMASPPLTTASMQNERAGRAAVDLLTHQLRAAGAETGELRRDLDCQLIVRGSTASPRDRH